MPLKLNISSVYIFSLLFALTAFLAAVFEWWFLLGVPFIMPFVYVFIAKPEYLIYLIAFASPLSVQLISDANIALALPTEPILIMLFVALLFKLSLQGNISLEVFRYALPVLILADLFWLGVTTISSTMPVISLKYLLSKSWYVGIAFFLCIHLFQKEKAIRIFLWCLILATCILALYTIYNHSQGSFSRSYAYTAMRPFLPDHGMYAAAVSFLVPISFIFAVYGKELGYNALIRLIALGIFGFLSLAVALSFTRASWMSLVIAFAVYAALLLKIKLRYLLLLTATVAVFFYINFDDIFTDLSRNKSESDDNIEEHLQSVSNVSTDPSNMERLNRWSCAVRMFNEKPFLGFGPGTYTFQYGIYQLPHEMTIISTNAGTLGNVHSEYLRPLVESGIIGFILILAIVLAVMELGFRQFSHLSGSRKYLSLGAFLGLITYFSHGLLNNYSEFDKIAVPMFGFMAIMVANQMMFRKSQQVEAEKLEE